MNSQPVISVVMGDPAGIGAEIIVKLLSEASLSERCRPFLIGDLQVMRDSASALESTLRFRAIDELKDACYVPGVLDVLNAQGFELGAVPPPAVHPKLGEAAGRYLE